MFVPTRLKTNAFRALRLSADATLSEIHKAAGGMRRAVSLGVANTIETDIPMLGELPRNEADIRAAIGRLENPTQRLSDRLFWFHLPHESRNAKTPARPSEPDGGACAHDDALRGLFAAFEAGFDNAGVSAWTSALRAWHLVVADDDYWAYILRLEQEGAFEPAAYPSELDTLRDEAVCLAAEPLVVAGRDALARSDTATARRVVIAIGELSGTGLWATAAQHDIVAPAVERFRALCHSVHEDFSAKIVREQDCSERNKGVCEAELKRFRDEIEPELNKLLQLIPPDHQGAQESREEAAICLSGIATDFTWADDFITSEKLREEALRLAQDTLGAIRIEDGLEQIRAAARKQRVFGSLKPISSAPSLQTINGFGVTILGKSDYDPETRSYATTRYFVALFVIPIFPIDRYRVIDMGDKGYSFLGKLPLRKFDRWHLGIVATAIVALILSGAFSSESSNVSTTPSASSYGTSSQRSGLSSLKDRIDSGRAQMTALKAHLQPVIDGITALNAQMEPLKAELKSLDEQQKAGVQIDIDGYNAIVKEHNALLAKQRKLIAANSADLKTYDDLVDQDSVLVKQYNELLK